MDDEPFLFDLVDGSKVLKLTPSQQHNVTLREKLQSDWELVTERIKAFDLNETSTGKKSQKILYYFIKTVWAIAYSTITVYSNEARTKNKMNANEGKKNDWERIIYH